MKVEHGRNDAGRKTLTVSRGIPLGPREFVKHLLEYSKIVGAWKASIESGRKSAQRRRSRAAALLAFVEQRRQENPDLTDYAVLYDYFSSTDPTWATTDDTARQKQISNAIRRLSRARHKRVDVSS